MFTASGLLVRFLKVFEKSGYQSVKWVRYLSKANGSYQIRVSTVSMPISVGRVLTSSFDVPYVCCRRRHDLHEDVHESCAKIRVQCKSPLHDQSHYSYSLKRGMDIL